MKCDKLKARKAKSFSANWSGEWYQKPDVDEAIAELKAEHHKERDEYISMVNSREPTIQELKAETETLNGLWNAWNTYQTLGDTNKQLRSTRRALWLARAERAKEVVASANGGITKYGENDNALRYFLAIEKAWKKIEQLCRAKAEEYK